MGEQVFVRKASGLVRAFSSLDVMVYACALLGVGMSINYYIGNATFIFPNGNIFVGLLITTIICTIVGGFVFNSLTTMMPRSGGPYVYASRVLGAPLGFLTSWIAAIAQMFWFGIFGGTMATWVLPIIFSQTGASLGNPDLINLSYWATSFPNNWVLGTILIIGFGLVPILGMRAYAKYNLTIWFVAILGSIIAYIVLFSTPNSEFLGQLDRVSQNLGGPTAYGSVIIDAAKSSGWQPPIPNDPWVTFKLGFAVFAPPTFWAIGAAASYVAGEVKRVGRSVWVGGIGAVIVQAALTAGAAIAIFSSVGQDLFSALTYLFTIGGAEYFMVLGWAIPPYWNAFASIVTQSVPIILVIGIGLIAWHMINGPKAPVAVSRFIMAWSFDGLFPKALADVNPRFRVPVKAIVLTVIIAAFFNLIFSLRPGWFTYQYPITIEVIFFFLIGLTALILPYKLKDIFEASPVKWRIGGIPLLSIFGALQMIIAAFVLFIFSTEPGYGYVYTLEIILVYIAIFASGIGVFYGFRAYRKSKGVEIDKVYKEIPPE